MEPERPIEKLLRASAKRRREEAGPPFEMHPATRRLLQGEVTREVKPKGQGAEPGRRPLGLWMRLGWTLGVLVVLGLAASVILPEFYRPRPQAVTTTGPVDKLAYSENKPSATEELTRNRTQAPVAVDKQKSELADLDVASRRTEIAQARAAAPAAPQPGNLLNEPLATTPAPAAIVASESDAVTKRKLETEAKSTVPSATPLAETAGVVPQGRTDTGFTDEFRSRAKSEPQKESSNALAFGLSAISTVTTNAVAFKDLARASQTQRFRRLDDSTQINGGAARKRFDAASGVLIDFQLEQTDRQLRIVDSDGSIYTGNLQTTQTTFRVPAAPSLSADDLEKAPAKLKAEAASPMSFVVIGTNRTLNLPVVFSGTFAFPARAAGAQVTSSNLAVARSFGGADRFQPLSTSRISGTARLGNTQVISVEAVPAEK